jgi:D-glycero-D-manno-heptose 1,7-bisphosphate phosphatase
MYRALIVDRDGTINVEKGYVFRPVDFEYLPGALAALRKATERGVYIYVVTNQAGIAKGLYTEEDFAVLTAAMLGEMAQNGIRIAEVLYCPHHPDATVPRYRQNCACRKPGVELIERAMARQGLKAGDVALIGDKNSDIEAGRRLGIATYLVRTGYGREEEGATKADHVVADLQAAIDHALSQNGNYRESDR